MRSIDTFGSASRLARRTAGAVGFVGAVGLLGAGCLSRPVEPGEPALKTNFTQQLNTETVDKIDMLFMIDNSASMGDKQVLLGQAVPALLNRLVTPNCLDPNTNKVLGVTADGTCTDSVTTGAGTQPPAGGTAEFQPIFDIHIGIVSSSLGGRGSDACPTQPTAPNNASKNPSNTALSAHNNDNAYLLNRVGDTETQLGAAVQGAAANSADPNNPSDPSNGDYFLAWFPAGPGGQPNPTKDPAPKQAETSSGTLNTDFTNIVTGVHEYGCGYEAQLESWYRFLVQPDPYQYVALHQTTTGAVSLQGIDQNILQERADFLRPNSLVAIIDLTDENDSTVDPMMFGGHGWFFEESTFPTSNTGGGAPKGTSACQTTPPGSACTSCGFCDYTQNPAVPANICTDSVCAQAGYYQPNSVDDGINERMFHMLQRFGADPQFPIGRYVNGLKSKTVPDQKGEHPLDANGNPSGNYVGNNDCTNPLFAGNLPTDPKADLCHLALGPRTPDLVYFAAITGITWQLLLTNQNDITSSNKATLQDADWTAIIGKDPLNYDFTGADVHMIESTTPRQGIPNGPGGTADAIVGYDYNTGGNDLEYACTFPFDTPKDCTQAQFANACDCTKAGATGADLSPLCDPTTPTTQVRGKAYPSIRELSVVRQMGNQGIVASLCPRTDSSGKLVAVTDPNGGYNPAVSAIISRLKNSLGNTCVPHALTPNANGTVDCLALVTLTSQAAGTPESVCQGLGFVTPDPTVLPTFQQGQHAQWLSEGSPPGGDLSTYPSCEIPQVVEAAGQTCSGASGAGWCYVVGAPAKQCSYAIQYTKAAQNQGVISLQCVEANTIGDGGSGGSTTGG